MAKETITDKQPGKLTLTEAQFHQGVQVEGELITSYSTRRNVNYTLWVEPGLRIVVMLHKPTGDIFFTPLENVKAGKFEKRIF